MNELFIKKNFSIKKSLDTMNRTGRKCLVVLEKNKLYGTLSDGDLRKAITKGSKLNENIEKIINKKPFFCYEKSIDKKKIRDLFLQNLIDLIPVVDENNKVKKIILWEEVFGKPYFNSINKNKNVPIIIMAGGKGTRLLPFTQVLPKPLIPINGKTIIERIIENFTKYEFNKFKFIINYKSLLLKAYLKELKSSIDLHFLEEKKELGTAGGLYLLKNKIRKNFILSNCDILVNCDYNDLISYHEKNENIMTIVIAAKEITIPYGNCILNNRGQLKFIDEKPNLDYLINTGLYVFNKKVINYINKNSFLDMNDLINNLLKSKNKIGVFPIDESQWNDIGQWSEYKKTLEKI